MCADAGFDAFDDVADRIEAGSLGHKAHGANRSAGDSLNEGPGWVGSREALKCASGLARSFSGLVSRQSLCEHHEQASICVTLTIWRRSESLPALVYFPPPVK